MIQKLRLIVSFVILLNNVDVLFGANILVLNGLPSPSHHLWTSNILGALAARGHNVTSIGPDVDNKLTPNLHEIHLENIYSVLYSGRDDSFDFNAMSEANPFAEVFFYADFCEIVCNATMESKGFEKIMSYPKNFKFDLILYDFTCGPCLLSTLSRFIHQPPIVAITAFSHPPFLKCLIGEHPHYAYVPFYSLSYTDNMTFTQRLLNSMLYVFDNLYRQNIFVPRVEKMVENKLQEKLPTGLKELERTTNLALINSHPSFDYPQPLAPNVIDVAGLHIKEVKPVPKELKDFIEPAKKGFVIFSLGTNIRSDQLPPKIQQNIIKAFEQLPNYRFLWKFESDTLPRHPAKNVLVQKWLPQNDLLGHSKVKAFITHGGMLSTQEATWYGVPIIGIPFIVDQYRNVQKCVTAGVGERIYIKSLTTEELKMKLLKVLEDKSYAEKMKLRSTHFRDQITKPLDRTIWWIEWAIRNQNAEHMKSPILKLGDFVANLYDILLTILIGIGALAFILYKIVRRCVRGLFNRNQLESKKEKLK